MTSEQVSVFVANDGATAIVSCNDSCTVDWSGQVAWEFRPASVIFVWRKDGKWTAWKVDEGRHSMPSQTDLELVAGCLSRERTLRPGDHVVFRCEVPDASTTEVKEVKNIGVTVPRRRSSVLVWLQRLWPWGHTHEQVLTDQGMAAWIKQENAEPIRQIVLSLRSPTGVIPFLGAGMSAVFKYPLWDKFFEKFANDAADGTLPGVPLSQAKRAEVIAHLAKQEFEKAAKILVDWNSETFYKRVEKDFGEEPDLVGKATPLTRLPLIAPGPIITTNVDPVVEAVYEKMGKPFSDDRRILGARKPPEHQFEVVAALQRNLSTLIKLHGDAKKPSSLVFTEVEYEQGYGNDDHPGPIERLATVLYTNRPLLFLGCSLTTDRTLDSLKRVYKRNPYVGHYAVLAPPFRSSKRDERVRELRDAAGIRVLWYPPGQHPLIDALLKDLVSRSALDEINLPPNPAQPGAPTVTATPPQSAAPTGTATPPPLTVPGGSAATAATSDDEQPERFLLTQDHIESVSKALVAGKLVFSFGSAVNTNRISGDQFYEQICKQAGIPWPRRDRADAAQYVADMDRAKLSAIVKQLIQTNCTQPSQAHRFVATLPAKLKQLGHNSDLMIITTNYDAMTEAAFAGTQQPYHLFVYNHYGLHAGRFLHRDVGGAEFAIRTPAAINEPLKAPAIVKLNGGIDLLGRLPETFVVASSDFEELSTRLPDVLPQVVWDALRQRPILFLGHGLAEPDIRSLIRRRKNAGAPTSWAVQKTVDKADVPYLQSVGIEPIQADLNVYLNRLESALNAAIPPVP